MSLIKRLFGSKGEKFYLELEETATEVAGEAKKQVDKVTDSQPIQNATATVTEIAQEAKKQVDKVTDSQPVQNATTIATEVTQETKEQVKSATNSRKTSVKKGKTTKQNNGPQPTTATNSSASSWEPPFWVKAMYKNSSNSNGQVSTSEQTFASDNLMPTITKYRRRPGPSLNKFKDMASKAKTPKG